MVDIIDSETGEVLSDKPKFELVMHDGHECKYYPASGAVIRTMPNGQTRFVANRGGRPDFDPHEMVAAREIKKEEAILRGLEEAGYNMDMRSAGDVLARIVAARATNAIEDEGRTGNSDAKFIFSLISAGGKETSEESRPALRIDMDGERAQKLLEKLIEL